MDSISRDSNSGGLLPWAGAILGAIGLLLLGGLSIVLGAWTRIGAMFLLMVAAFGGTAVRSPLLPKQQCSEFCAIVSGCSVHTRGPIFFHSSSVPANSGAPGSMNARCPAQPGPL